MLQKDLSTAAVVARDERTAAVDKSFPQANDRVGVWGREKLSTHLQACRAREWVVQKTLLLSATPDCHAA